MYRQYCLLPAPKHMLKIIIYYLPPLRWIIVNNNNNNKDNHANSSVPPRFKLIQNSLLATYNWCVAPSKGILGFGIQNSRLSYNGRDALLNSIVSSATENFMRSKFSLSLIILIQFLPFLIAAAFNAVIVLMPKIWSPFEQKWLISHSKASVALSRCLQMIRLSLDSSSWKSLALMTISQKLPNVRNSAGKIQVVYEREEKRSYIKHIFNVFAITLASVFISYHCGCY